jgi:hypothetical protein
MSHADCAAAGKSCDSDTLTCVPCQQNSDCASGACRADHVCAAAGDLVYVDNSDGTCSGAHTGTAADPFCQVAPALAATGSTILVAGSSVDYDAIAVSSALNKAIVGPGRGATQVARFAQSTKSGASINLATGSATISIAGVVLSGSTGGVNAPGVACTLTPGATIALSVTRSRIASSGAHGIDSNGCAITLDANDITQNVGGGIKINGGSYTVTNNLIGANGNNSTATVPGFTVDASATGTFSFNTVAKNQVAAGVAGIDCSAASHALSSSIVFGNTTAAGSQFAGACTYADVVAGVTEGATGPTKLDPAFVSTSDYRLDVTAGAAKTANDACCIDKLAAGPDHDVDGKHRPVRAAWDIGAFEAP